MTGYEMLKLENQLCYPLYAAAKDVVSRYKPLLDEIDLTYTQYIAMMVMWEHESVGVSQMGDLLRLDSGTLTPLLKRLESKGYIRRARSETDERAVILTLTEEGKSLAQKASGVPQAIRSCLSLTDEEAVTLYQLLYKVLEKPGCQV